MKIDPNKKYRTRDGRDVEMLHRLPEGWPTNWPIHGIIDGVEMSWSDDGIEDVSGKPSQRDLIEVREPLEVDLVITREVNISQLNFFRNITLVEWDKQNPHNAPHRIAKFREVIE